MNPHESPTEGVQAQPGSRRAVRQPTGIAHLRLAGPAAAHRLPRIRQVPRARVLAKPVRLPPLTGAPAREIAARLGESLVLFVIDDSGSMYFPPSGDQRGVRYAVALSIVELMRRGGGGRAAVVHFGSLAPPQLALAATDVRRERRALRRALSIPLPTLGGTNLAAGLDRAAELAQSAEPGRTLAFVIGDGIEPVTPAIHDAIAALGPAATHMLLVDTAGGCSPSLEAEWRDCPLGSFHRMELFDTAALADQIARIVATTLGLRLQSRTDHANHRRSR